MYQASLENLEFYAIIGILPHERLTVQKVILNARLSYQSKEEYIDYAKAARLLENHIKEQQFELIEDALASCAMLLKKHFPQIKSLYLQIKKPQILPNVTPSVSISLNFT
ncbi:MAG: dihydroneopterin aldolase [Epsilonproteobacteria bacterium]|nr:dihydroneopterin aldolase [Campylobacterota bacterium]NPA64134.1 dihydroneopterin aldolase [Campylobacterota bacterium]